MCTPGSEQGVQASAAPQRTLRKPTDMFKPECICSPSLYAITISAKCGVDQLGSRKSGRDWTFQERTRARPGTHGKSFPNTLALLRPPGGAQASTQTGGMVFLTIHRCMR